VVKVSPARNPPAGAVNVWLLSPRYSYSIFTDQLGANAHSIPAPTSQPLFEGAAEELARPLLGDDGLRIKSAEGEAKLVSCLETLREMHGH
jgi:hypothetical protein